MPYFSQVYELFPSLMASGKTYTILFLCSWLNFGQFIAYFNIWRWRQEVTAEKDNQKSDLYKEIIDDPDQVNALLSGEKIVEDS
jgi:hypothetical protein